MPVQSNFAVQNLPLVAWDGSAAIARDVRKFVGYAFAFEVTGTIATDAVFSFDVAPASDANPAVAGTYAAAQTVPKCSDTAAAADATITIPAGTAVGSIFTVTLPCRAAFVRVTGDSGTVANVLGTIVLHGPKI